jgi:hypothetical protein
LFFNNLDLCHIERELSLFSLSSTVSLVWTEFQILLDTKPDTKSANPTTKFSLSDEAEFCSLSQS